MSMLSVKRATSSHADAAQAIAEVQRQLEQAEVSLVILFVSARYDLKAVEDALRGAFRCPVIGCTTAGEITSSGYIAGGVVGVSLASPSLFVHPKLIAPLDTFGLAEGEQLAGELRGELRLGTDFEPRKMFSLLLVDGLSMLEEQVVATLHRALAGVPLFGGSAGDDLSLTIFRSRAPTFSSTAVFAATPRW